MSRAASQETFPRSLPNARQASPGPRAARRAPSAGPTGLAPPTRGWSGDLAAEARSRGNRVLSYPRWFMAPLLGGRYRLLSPPDATPLRAQDLLRGGTRRILLFPLGRVEPSALTEAPLEGRVRHPHLLEVHGAGQIDEGPLAGRVYVVTEDVDAPTLAEAATKAPMPAEALLRIARSAYSALRALHELGIVHAGVEPERLHLFPGGCRVGGLGLAALCPAALRPEFRAPDVRAGAAPSPRADAWSLGATLYWAASGRIPEGNSPLPLEELRPDLPAPLARTIALLLSFGPSAREETTVRSLLGLEPSPTPARLEPRFVGRSADLRAVLAAVEEAEALAAAGRAAREAVPAGSVPPFVSFAGEEGFGKTRLLEEAAARLLRRGVRVLWAHGSRGRAPGALWETVLGRAERLGGDATLAARARSACAEGAPVRVAGEWIARALLDFARRGPVALFVDDAHCLSRLDLELLLQVARAAAAPGALGPLALVLSVRPDGAGLLDELLAAPLAPEHVVRSLGPLSDEEAHALATSLLPPGPEAAEVVGRLTALGGGCPFLLAELAREWRRGGGTPASVREAIDGALRRASPEGRTLLSALAVLDGPAPRRLCQALPLGGPCPHDAVLTELVALGLLEPEEGGASFAFRQGIARQVVREGLDEDGLAALSERVLAACEASGAGSAHERARLALQARRPDAVDRALAATEEGPGHEALYELLLDALEPGARRAEVCRRLAACLRARSALAEARRALELGLADLAEEPLPSPLQATLWLDLSRLAGSEGDAFGALEGAARGLAALADLGAETDELRARLLASEGRALLLRGDPTSARARYAEAIAALGPGPKAEVERARFLVEEAQARVLSLDKASYQTARHQVEEAMGVLRRSGEEAALRDALRVLGNHAFYSGDLNEAERCFAEALRASEAAADLAMTSGMLNNLGMVAAQRGEARRAEGLFVRALDQGERLGQPAVVCRATTNLARVRRDLGDLAAARRLFARAARLARASGDAVIESAALSELGTTCLRSGRLQAAQRALLRSRRLRLERGDPGRVAWSELELGELWRTCGDVRAALAHTGHALALQAALGDVEAAAVAVEALEFAVGRPGGPAALLAGVRKPLRPGRRWPDAVVRVWERGAPLAEGALRLLATALAARGGDTERAGAHAARVRRAALALRATERPSPALEGLATCLEREAAAAVAGARGNAEGALAAYAQARAALGEAEGTRAGALWLKEAFLHLACGDSSSALSALSRARSGGRGALPEALWIRRRIGFGIVAAALRRRGVNLGEDTPDALPLAAAEAEARRLGDVALLALVESAQAEAAGAASPLTARWAREAARRAAERLVEGLPSRLREGFLRSALWPERPGRDTAGPSRPAEDADAPSSSSSLPARAGEATRAPSSARTESSPGASTPSWVGRSPAMQAIARLIERYGRTNAPVTVQGESGAGKELVARAVHAASPRREGPFVAINCAALPDTLLESELFGVVKGAFTGADRDRPGLFEQAHGGTLFLDEVGDMSLDMQAKLLRVLESGELRRVGGHGQARVDVRVVSATHRDLRRLAAEGRFREDLYYRLNVLRLEVPPLRDRREDIPLLCAHFLREVAARQGTPPKELAPEAIERLLGYSFPGNVRELRNIIERACALEPEPIIGPQRLDLGGSADAPAPAYHKTFECRGVALNRRQKTLLERLRREGGSITNRDYCALVGVSERTGLRDLGHLLEHGLLERVGKRKGARYRLTPDGALS
ncbi:MAG: hypothetical protein D6731_06390 [Planctomycetota bacterium]|nr:MAG: hypothetical protein D6731_06390 [Planctomycetota bacterium]